MTFVEPGVEERALPDLSKRRVVAAAMSCVIPGAGELFVGDYRRGAISLLFFLILVLLCWPFRVVGRYGGLFLVLFATLILWCSSALTALLTKRSPYPRVSKKWLWLVIPMIYAGWNLALFWQIRGAGYRPFQDPSSSMEPTVMTNDYLVADMWAYRKTEPKPGDLILFRHNGIILLKRVIAGAGDVVEGNADHISVNGKSLEEPYADYQSPNEDIAFGPIKVLAGQFFVVGDHRNFSYDSRFPEFGAVSRTDVLGRPLYIYRAKPRSRSGTYIH